MSHFYPLVVEKIQRITPQAVTLDFRIPKKWKKVFRFRAGQYITLKKELNGQEIRRSYSICSTPRSGALVIGVKKTYNGLLSRFLNDDVRVGDTLEVHIPEGRFVFIPEKNKGHNIAAFAAGSGITPIMSILQTVLEEEPHSTFTLVYGNRRPADTMFFEDIRRLQGLYPGRLFVYFVYSNAREEDSLFGRIDASVVNYVLKNKQKGQVFEAFYLCGPAAMMETVTGTLLENGYAQSCILTEFFEPPQTTEPLVQQREGMVNVTVVLDGVKTSFEMNAKERILEGALEQGIDAPYSCQGGICSSCVARLTEGKVAMATNQILTESELKEGLILTCQAQPLTDRVVVDYDDI